MAGERDNPLGFQLLLIAAVIFSDDQSLIPAHPYRMTMTGPHRMKSVVIFTTKCLC